ncbi:probable E3 ubiquitin-protein ligase RHY1A isoform X2 [Cryptomeria japonica]|uniref:probable E3 ubiquitin-protein ligase RHY1A isoform X2 n=1 Tax=Cryptomeria japonica TaxID=3369 RepID=UPI0025ABFCAD|nr:probable E3 ubiquitin-protein ligase RHY1A isoform X2 [Cryptomeria japonica]
MVTKDKTDSYPKDEDHQVLLSEQRPRLGSESNVDISSHGNGVQLKNLLTFSEQAIKNNNMHGAAMCARDRLHQKFKAASLLDNRMQGTSSTGFRVENYARSDKYGSLSGIEWENYVRHWLASILQSESLAINEKSEHENLELEKEECPICLDSFLPREQKIKLPCSHRFHIACLTPWLLIHRDCPYCRANVCL